MAKRKNSIIVNNKVTGEKKVATTMSQAARFSGVPRHRIVNAITRKSLDAYENDLWRIERAENVIE